MQWWLGTVSALCGGVRLDGQLDARLPRGPMRSPLEHRRPVEGRRPDGSSGGVAVAIGEDGERLGKLGRSDDLHGYLGTAVRVAESGFQIRGYDIPGATDGGIAGGGSARRQHHTTVTDQAVFVWLSSVSLDELEGHWDALVDGGTVVEPLAASDRSAGSGMLTDRFGVTWSLSVTSS